MFMPHSADRLVAETRQMAFSGQRPPTGTVDDLCAKRTNWSAKYGCTAPLVTAALGRVGEIARKATVTR